MSDHATETDRALPDAENPHRNHLAAIVGGKYDGRKVGLSGAPPCIDVGGLMYDRVDDPDTGAYLGGYVYRSGSTGSEATS